MNKSGSQGAALVELAVILPVLIMLAFGITELGRALYQHNTLGKATDLAARYMSRAWGAVDPDCGEDSNWPAAVTAARNLAVFGNEAGAGDALLPGFDGADISITLEAATVPASGETACTITVSSAVPFEGVFGEYMVPFTRFSPVTLSTRREVRYLGE